jgi:hypothetical protein
MHQLVKYKKGSELYIADTMSRDCDLASDQEDQDELKVLIILDMTEEGLYRIRARTGLKLTFCQNGKN